MAPKKAAKGTQRRTGKLVLEKSSTGISGLDEITGGGLPRRRATLVCGGPGCGKTLLALEFVLQGAARYDDPGVFVTFEETPDEVQQNVYDLFGNTSSLIRKKKILFDYVHIGRGEIEAAGDYSLDGLLIRLNRAIDSIGARRVVLDSIDALFGGIPDATILRRELSRLFRALKEKGVTLVVTAERGDGKLTREGLEEYVSDCVILLDQRISEQVSTRHLRVVKYRGSAHGTNEYPFLIGERGISVIPITSVELKNTALKGRISSGVRELDRMLGGQGYFRGSTVLVSGSVGSGKTSLANHFVEAACLRGERSLYLSFEESESQIIRNMRSIGISLAGWTRKGLLHFRTVRPTTYGLETHLAQVFRWIDEVNPRVVVLDPITDLEAAGSRTDVSVTLMRLVDYLKSRQITALLTSLTTFNGDAEKAETGISSLIDTWILLRNLEVSGERNRVLYIVKSRGMSHSNQVREFMMTNRGVRLKDVYLSARGVLTGSARVAHEAREASEVLARRQETERKQYSLERKRAALEARIAVLKAEFEAEVEQTQMELAQRESRKKKAIGARKHLARSRGVEEAST